MRKSDLQRRIEAATYADLIERTKTRPMPAVMVETLCEITRHQIGDKP